MYTYNIENIQKLRDSLSNDRLSTYECAALGDTESALKLYIWNTQISAAFYVPLQGLEVTLRNALHKQLSLKYNRDDWYEIAPINDRDKEKIQKAKDDVFRQHAKIQAPHVVAELSFGFWQTLLNKKYYQTLWIPTLYKAFPNKPLKLTDINTALLNLRRLRNRVAHHEPIFQRHLAKDYENLIQVINWICPETALWIDQHNTVQDVLRTRP
jgi:hypothetical protein